MAAFVLGFFSFCIEGIAVGSVTLVISRMKKENHRVKIHVLLAILGIIFGVARLSIMSYYSILSKMPASNYWFIRLVFGK